MILEPKKICYCFHIFLYLLRSDGTGCHDLSFLNVVLMPAFSLSAFTLIKRLFSSFLLSVIRVVSSAYLRLLIFLLASLIPACDSSRLVFHMMTLHMSEISRVIIYSLVIYLSQFPETHLQPTIIFTLAQPLHSVWSY